MIGLVASIHGGVGLVEVLTLLGALGAGGILKTVIDKYFRRDQIGAETEKIQANTNKMIAEIVQANTEQLKNQLDEATREISDLKKTIAELREQLNENRQIMRIRSLEADVRFYRARVQMLEEHNNELLEELNEGTRN